MSQFENVIDAIKTIANLKKDTKSNVSILNILSQYRLGWENGGKFIEAIGQALEQSKAKFMSEISTQTLEDAIERYGYIKKVRGIEGLLARPEVKEQAPSAGTTTANVAAYPVPLGSTLRSGEKKKHVKLEDIFAYNKQFARSIDDFAAAKVEGGYDINKLSDILQPSKSLDHFTNR
jgi:hypothetical protein